MAFMCFDYILLNFNERTVVNASLCWKPLCCNSNVWLEIIFDRNRYHWSSVQFECACSEVHAICDHWGTDRLSLYIYPNINETGLAQWIFQKIYTLTLIKNCVRQIGKWYFDNRTNMDIMFVPLSSSYIVANHAKKTTYNLWFLHFV